MGYSDPGRGQAYRREYYSRPEVIARLKAYRASERGRAVRRKYLESEKGKAACRRNHATYRATAKGKAACAGTYSRYMKSEKGINTRKVYTRSEARHRQDRVSRLIREYNITPEIFDSMSAAQGGGCAICRKPNTRRAQLVVDHDHSTGKVRGLLCDNCNLALGYLKDNLDILLRAADYLRSHR
jgi:protein-arginine kinase activator protein McsA